MKKGFTLLELLIVVIIIGVLATLAIPNFLRAAERARWAEAKSILGTLRGSQIRYYAQYQTYADDLANLDIDFTLPKHFSFAVAAADPVATATRSAGDYAGFQVTITVDGTWGWPTGGTPEWLK